MKKLALASVSLVGIILSIGANLAQERPRQQEKPTAGDLLDKLEKMPPLSQTVVVPSAKSPAADVPTIEGAKSSNSGERALQNLEKEESGRINRQILERLPQ